MGFNRSTFIPGLLAVMLSVSSVSFAAEPPIAATVTKANLGIIKGVVRDDGGNPIADATVAIFKVGTSRVLKQVRSATDGSFIARILPGTYTIFAVAQGYNPVTLAEVQVNGATQLTYGFKLERAGGGNTLPEKRLDRNNPKWVIRSAQTSRSIYQNTEGDVPAAEQRVTVEESEPEKTDDGSNRSTGRTSIQGKKRL